MGTTVLCTIMEGGDWWDPMDFATYRINATGTFTNSVDNGTSSATDCEARLGSHHKRQHSWSPYMVCD